MPATELPLKDLHLPETVGWWPPAIGWWLLAILIPVLIILCYRLYRYWTRKTAIKTAKKLLAELKLDSNLDEHQKLSQLSMLIRRVAVSISPTRHVAGLTGRAWLAFLDQGVKGAPFSEGVGQLLAEAPYRKTPPTTTELAQLISLCEDWLKTCKKFKS